MLACAVVAFGALQAVVSPVLPLLQAELGTSQATITWVLTANLVSASLLTPLLGALGDSYGKRRVLTAVLVVLAAGSLLAAAAGSVETMIVARVVQGVGGGVLPLGFGIVRETFPAARVAGAVGGLAALLASGGGAGLALAGPVAGALGTGALFWIPGAACALAALAIRVLVRESPAPRSRPIPAASLLLLSGWLTLLLVGLSQFGSGTMPGPAIAGLLIASVVAATVWWRHEWDATLPLVDVRMLRSAAVWPTSVVTLLFGGGLYSVLAFLPGFLQAPESSGYGFGATVTVSGLVVLPLSASMLVLGAAAGPLSRRRGPRTVLNAGSAVSAAAFACLALAHEAVWQVAAAMLLLGVGFGLALAASSTLAIQAVPAAQTGAAGAANANIRTVGGCLATALIGGLLAVGGTVRPTAFSYTASFWGLAALMALAWLAGRAAPRPSYT